MLDVARATFRSKWTPRDRRPSGGYYAGPSGCTHSPNGGNADVEDVAADSIGHAIEADVCCLLNNSLGIKMQRRFVFIDDARMLKSSTRTCQGRARCSSHRVLPSTHKTWRETNSEEAGRGCATAHARSYDLSWSCLYGLMVACGLIQWMLCGKGRRGGNVQRGTKRCRCSHKKKVLCCEFSCVCLGSQICLVYCLFHPINDYDIGHEDDVCCNIAMTRLRQCVSLNESGDSYTKAAGIWSMKRDLLVVQRSRASAIRMPSTLEHDPRCRHTESQRCRTRGCFF